MTTQELQEWLKEQEAKTEETWDKAHKREEELLRGDPEYQKWISRWHTERTFCASLKANLTVQLAREHDERLTRMHDEERASQHYDKDPFAPDC